MTFFFGGVFFGKTKIKRTLFGVSLSRRNEHTKKTPKEKKKFVFFETLNRKQETKNALSPFLSKTHTVNTKIARLCAFHPHDEQSFESENEERERLSSSSILFRGLNDDDDDNDDTTTTTFQTQSSVCRNRGALASSPNAKKILVVGKTAAPRHKKTSIRFDVRANGGISRDAEQMAGLGGDFGARDPTAGEIGSNFGTSTLGHADTDHIVKASGKGAKKLKDMTMLKNRPIQELPADATACTLTDEEIYRKQCVDWKVRPSNKDSIPRLRWEVTTTDGEKFAARCQAVANEAGWPVETTATGEKVVVEVHTKEVKGLTINDFIVATKIEADEEIAGMIVKKAKAVRNWA